MLLCTLHEHVMFVECRVSITVDTEEVDVSDGQWHHVVVRRQTTAGHIMLDGVHSG